MGDCVSAMEKVQAFIMALCEAEGIEQTKLAFKWSAAREIKLPEHGIRLKQSAHTIRAYLGKRYIALTFTDHDLQEGEKAPAEFLSVSKDRIITALCKLKRHESRIVKR